MIAASLALPPVVSAADHWRRVTTPRFTYFSSSHPDDVRRTAHQLESMAMVLGQLGLGAPTGCRPRTVLIGFADRRAFDPHRPLSHGRPLKVEGYCMSVPFGRWIGYLETEDRGRLIARHEFAHTVVSDAFWRVPLCLNEGMAEFLSTFQVVGEEISFGHALDWHRYVIQSSDLMSLDELFAARAESLDAAGGDATNIFYAESWALVHYLARGGFDGLMGFVQAIAGGEEPRPAFESAFPAESWDGLPRRLKSYVDSEVRQYHVIERRKVSLPPASAIVLNDALPGEAMTHIGLWRVYSTVDPAGTARCFDQALAEGPLLGLALAGKGTLALHEERLDEASTHFRQSVAGTPDAQTLFVAGYGLLMLGQERGRAERGRLTEEAFALLERSVALDSTDAHALAWYGRAGASMGNHSDTVIRALDRASKALPSDAVLATDLASILARIGAVRRSAEVRSGLTRVVPGGESPDGASIAIMPDSLITMYNLGVESANQGSYARAVEHFQRAAAAAGPGAFRDSVEVLIRRLKGRPDRRSAAGK